MLIYLFIKRSDKGKLWHLAPKMTSLEMPIVTFTVLLLIGATGNTTSVWFPLTFVHLFLLAMASENSTAVTGSLAVVLFHFAMTPLVTQLTLVSLANIPLVLFFFLFAKSQYHEAVREELVISKQEGELESVASTNKEIEYFLNEVLLPKLAFMHELIENPIENAESMRGQMTVIEEEALRAAQRLQEKKNIKKE
jgi:hypothetical protein